MDHEVQSCRYTPPSPLAAFVRCFWYWQGIPQPHLKERLLPTGEASIIFNLRDEPFRIYDAENFNRFTTHRQAVLSGARSTCFGIDTESQECVVGIQFRPGGLFPFLSMPASDAEGLTLDLEAIWPSHASDIRDRLLASPSAHSMLKTLESCLLNRMVRPLNLHQAVTYAIGEFEDPGCSVATVVDRIGMSSNRFIQLFHHQVGLTPKLFSRLRRFQSVLETIHTTQDFEWAQVALACGYYDQAHFINDFQAFSGLTPRRYAALATPHLNHVPIS